MLCDLLRKLPVFMLAVIPVELEIILAATMPCPLLGVPDPYPSVGIIIWMSPRSAGLEPAAFGFCDVPKTELDEFAGAETKF